MHDGLLFKGDTYFRYKFMKNINTCFIYLTLCRLMSIHENLMLVQQMKKSTLYLLILSIFGCVTCNNYDIKSCLNLIFV